jgi:hypothetical protein
MIEITILMLERPHEGDMQLICSSSEDLTEEEWRILGKQISIMEVDNINVDEIFNDE